MNTKEYYSFRTRKDNRPIKESHILALKRNILISNDLHLNPIVVTEDMQVIDGQHRLIAASQLGVPIYYLVDRNFKPKKMITLNKVQLRWSIDNYLNYYIANGTDYYKEVGEVAERYGLTLTCVLLWLFDGRETIQRFKEGKFCKKITEKDIENLNYLEMFKNFTKDRCSNHTSIFKHKALHKALNLLFRCNYFDTESFFRKLNIAPHRFTRRAVWTEYLTDIIEIYNYKRIKQRLMITLDKNKAKISY